MRGKVRKARRQESRGSSRRVRCVDGERDSWSQTGKVLNFFFWGNGQSDSFELIELIN
jgi:hypothetical protein